MQSLLVVDNRSIRSLQGCIFDVSDRGYDRADAGLLQALIRAHSHAARQQNLAISDRRRHAVVGILGSRIETVGLPLDVNVFAGAPAVSHLLTLFAAKDLPILNRQDDVVRRATKVLADGHTIFRNGSDVHR